MPAWNPSTCSCECIVCEYMEDSMIGEYWKDCEFMKDLFGNLIVTCNETEGTPESVVINASNVVNEWLIADILLAINNCC